MKNQNRVYRNRGKNGGEDLLRIKARNKSKSVAVGNFKNGAHIFPRGSIERRRFTRVAPKSVPPLNKSAGLRNKTFLQRDKFITKITAIERRGGAAREEGGGGRGEGEGRAEGKWSKDCAGDLDTLERFVAPGGTERAIVISRGGAWKRLRLRLPISRTRNHD